LAHSFEGSVHDQLALLFWACGGTSWQKHMAETVYLAFSFFLFHSIWAPTLWDGTGYKINIQKSVDFTYANDKLTKK
jgi:hypothetical protein